MDWLRSETWKAYERPESEVTGNKADGYERRAPGTAGMRDGVRYQFYETADGHVLFMASEREFWENFCKAIDRADLFEQHPGSQYADHARGNTELRTELATIFRSRTTAEWIELGNRANTPIAPVNTPKTLADDPQFQDRLPWIPQERVGNAQVPSPIKVVDEEHPLPTKAPDGRRAHRRDPPRGARLRRRPHRRATGGGCPRLIASPVEQLHERVEELAPQRFAEEGPQLVGGAVDRGVRADRPPREEPVVHPASDVGGQRTVGQRDRIGGDAEVVPRGGSCVRAGHGGERGRVGDGEQVGWGRVSRSCGHGGVEDRDLPPAAEDVAPAMRLPPAVDQAIEPHRGPEGGGGGGRRCGGQAEDAPAQVGDGALGRPGWFDDVAVDAQHGRADARPSRASRPLLSDGEGGLTWRTI